MRDMELMDARWLSASMYLSMSIIYLCDFCPTMGCISEAELESNRYVTGTVRRSDRYRAQRIGKGVDVLGEDGEETRKME